MRARVAAGLKPYGHLENTLPRRGRNEILLAVGEREYRCFQPIRLTRRQIPSRNRPVRRQPRQNARPPRLRVTCRVRPQPPNLRRRIRHKPRRQACRRKPRQHIIQHPRRRRVIQPRLRNPRHLHQVSPPLRQHHVTPGIRQIRNPRRRHPMPRRPMATGTMQNILASQRHFRPRRRNPSRHRQQKPNGAYHFSAALIAARNFRVSPADGARPRAAATASTPTGDPVTPLYAAKT